MRQEGATNKGQKVGGWKKQKEECLNGKMEIRN
jgi:hypothetical protein